MEVLPQAVVGPACSRVPTTYPKGESEQEQSLTTGHTATRGLPGDSQLGGTYSQIYPSKNHKHV